MIQHLCTYMMVMSLITYGVYGLDKWKAKNYRWRIPEVVLLGLSLAGGWLGAWFGMYTWHHKTRKPKFVIGVPLTAAVWIILIVFLLVKG